MRKIKASPMSWFAVLLCTWCLTAPVAEGQTTAPTPQGDDRFWNLEFVKFFKGGTAPLTFYARDHKGQWKAAVGTPRIPPGKSRSFNKSFLCGDLSGAPIKDGAMKGTVKVHMTPDPWVPTDHKSFVIVLEVDARLQGDRTLAGTYRLVSAASGGYDVSQLPRTGELKGSATFGTVNDLPDPATLRCNMQGAKIGGDPKFGDRCMVLLLGMEKGRLANAMVADLDIGGRTYGGLIDARAIPAEGNTGAADRDAFKAHVAVPSRTLDMEPCEYVFDLQGQVFGNLLVGTYKLTVKVAGKAPLVIDGSFDGAVQPGLPAPPKSAVEVKFAPADVKDFVPVKPGEHPRLLFRKSDLPALRQRAQTPEGQAIIARLRTVLGGNGETFATAFSKATKGYDNTPEDPALFRPGGFTLGHAAGYGLLYQLTGEKKYADLGRQAFEKMMQGVRDPDDRYSFVGPNGELRAGSSWATAALGYDLCYDGWDEDFRRKVARAFLTVTTEQGTANLRKVVTSPTHPPTKNHFGGIICGAVAAVAIMGDPGTEGQDIASWLPAAYEQLRRMLTGGFGDHGFYSEGHGPSSVSADTGLLIWLKVAKVACGKDFISVAPNAQWITLRHVMEIVPVNGSPQWLDRRSSAGKSYGTEHVRRGRAQFAQGFGAVEAKYLPAVLWTYQNFIEAPELRGVFGERSQDYIANGWIARGQKSYDVLSEPLYGVLSFVNWPIGVTAQNPEKVLPKAMEDRVHGYYVFRNQWKDENDILVSALLGYGPKDAFRPQWGPIYLWGLKKKYEFGNFLSDAPADFAPGPHGGVVATEKQCLAVDFSGACGAPALLVLAGIDPPAADATLAVTPLPLSGRKVHILTLQTGQAPAARAEGDRIVIGGQTVTWDGKKIVLAK